MFAVAGRWDLEPGLADDQAAALPDIVCGVQSAPGFVHGFWSRDVGGSTTNLTYIVFETRAQAERFRASVLANAPAQHASGVGLEDLLVVEVIAHAEG